MRDCLCPELPSEALWWDIYRCGVSNNLLPPSPLCPFNERVSLRFLLNLFFWGREQRCPSLQLETRQEKGSWRRVSPFRGPFSLGGGCRQLLECPALSWPPSECGQVSRQEEDPRNRPRVHLVLLVQGDLPSLLEVRRSLVTRHSMLFISRMGKLRPFDARWTVVVAVFIIVFASDCWNFSDVRLFSSCGGSSLVRAHTFLIAVASPGEHGL